MQDFQGKCAFVTGGASGIGLGMVKAFLAEGMRVAMVDIEQQALDRAAAGLATNAVLPLQCDISDKAALDRCAQDAIDQFGKVHVVCNNAGVSSGGLVDELDEGDWLWNANVNYLGVVNGCRAFVPHLKQHGEGGHIVNTASIAGLLGRAAGWGPYISTKYAVVGFTEVLHEEGKLAGFGASVLCPGAVATDIMQASRNRPDRFGPQVSKVAYNDISDELAQGLAPEVVGQLVVEAIRAERLHIFTDPRQLQGVRNRFAGIEEDFAWAAQSSALKSNNAPGTDT